MTSFELSHLSPLSSFMPSAVSLPSRCVATDFPTRQLVNILSTFTCGSKAIGHHSIFE
jgi:hypothetical protein